MEHPFDQLDGVVSVTVGYMGGRTPRPTYEGVSSGETGHLESVQVVYDPRRVSYEKLLDAFWHNIDPLTPDGQFCDHGPQYQTAVFYRNTSQRRLAEDSKVQVARRFRRPVATQIRAAGAFTAAEDYHQHYYRTHAIAYKAYRLGCGRDRRLQELWGDGANTMGFDNFHKPGDAELRRSLNPLQYQVTQHEATESAFHNEFWDNHRAGIYVDVVSGEPLFSSLDKFESGTGWPSFTKPLEPQNVRQKTDRSLFMAGLLRARPRRGNRRGDGHDLRDAPHRGDVRRVRRAPRTRLSRRAAADGTALLHQLRGAAVRPGGPAGRRRLRAVPAPVPDGGETGLISGPRAPAPRPASPEIPPPSDRCPRRSWC